MTQGILSRDQNFIPMVGAVNSVTDTSASARSLQYNPTTRGLTVHVVGNDATPLTDGNSSLVFSYNADGALIYVDETIGTTTYRRTMTNADMTIATTKSVSIWV